MMLLSAKYVVHLLQNSPVGIAITARSVYGASMLTYSRAIGVRPAEDSWSHAALNSTPARVL